MVKCLMLDVDGVLVDGRPKGGKPWKYGLTDDLGIAPEDLRRNFFIPHWQEIVVGRKDLIPTLARSLESIGATVGVDELVGYWFANDARVVAPVFEDCRTARAGGLPIFLATNQEHNRAAYLMADMGLAEAVDGIIYSARAGCAKPEPDFYAYAEATSGFGPCDLLLVDDTPANIDAARRAGWQAAHWDGSERLAEILARH